jgi:integrase
MTRSVAARFAGVVGERPLTAITALDVEAYLNRRKSDGASPATINGELQRLRCIFRWLKVRARVIKRNPAKFVDKLRVEDPDPSRWLTADEVARIMRQLDVHPTYRDITLLAVNLALRVREVLGIKAEHVDLAKRRIGVLNVKTRKLEYVGLNEVAVAVLASRKLRTPAGPIFPTRNGTLMLRWNVHRRFKRIVKAAGVPRATLHLLRHFCLTENAEVMPERKLGTFARHKHPSTTAKYYVHLRAISGRNIT